MKPTIPINDHSSCMFSSTNWKSIWQKPATKSHKRIKYSISSISSTYRLRYTHLTKQRFRQNYIDINLFFISIIYDYLSTYSYTCKYDVKLNLVRFEFLIIMRYNSSKVVFFILNTSFVHCSTFVPVKF